MWRTQLCVTSACTLLGAMLMAVADEPQAPGRGPARRPEPARILEQFDKNQDGLLDASELPKPLQQRFEQFDRNRDGKLSREELQQGMARGGRLANRRPGQPAGARGPNATDNKPPEERSGEGLPDPLFQMLDADDDMRLSADELRNAPGLLAKRDRNKDGELDREELVAALRGGGRPGEYVAPAAKGERHKDTLQVGDMAPDFTLPDLRGKREITLSSFRDKRPVVLIFASYTWPPFRRQSGDVERLYQAYKDRAEFLLVYIREAHPDSELYTVRDGQEVLTKVVQTDSLEERTDAAQMCVDTLRLSCPTVIDRSDNAVNIAYAGWPDRFAIVGMDGRIAFMGAQGPKGFKPEEVEEWLREHLD